MNSQVIVIRLHSKKLSRNTTNSMPNEIDVSLKQKELKRKLTNYTIIYIVLFPVLWIAGMVSPMVTSGPSTPDSLVLPLILLVFLMPISVPVSIYLMWSRYCSKKYDKARIFARLPIFTIISVFAILEVTCWLARVLPKFFNAS